MRPISREPRLGKEEVLVQGHAKTRENRDWAMMPMMVTVIRLPEHTCEPHVQGLQSLQLRALIILKHKRYVTN